jgi:uncharacterized repeat protein (TIGR03803 family)
MSVPHDFTFCWVRVARDTVRPNRILRSLAMQLICAAVMCAVAAIISPAQTFFNTVATFGPNVGGLFYAPIQASNGNLYGTSYQGGTGAACQNSSGCGTIYQLTPAGALSTLYNFCSQPNCADGQWPYGGLAQGPNGSLYGTTTRGGANGYGSVFEITSEGALTTLYSFCSAGPPECSDGSQPYAGLLLGQDGNFYGTTEYGGSTSECQATRCGTVFQITPEGVLTTLSNFADLPAEQPVGTLVPDSSGNLYGVTTEPLNPGTIFQATTGGGLNSEYFIFPCQEGGPENCYDGDEINPPIMSTNGIVVSAQLGGRSGTSCLTQPPDVGCGTVYGLNSGVLYNFCALTACADGANPVGVLVQAPTGNLYGTTAAGGANTNCTASNQFFQPGCGTVYEINPTTQSLTTLYNFCSQPNCADGSYPSGLMQASNGTFYGVTDGCYYSSSTSCTIFSLSNTDTTLTLTPASLNFGVQAYNATSAAKTVTVANTGTGTLDISAVSILASSAPSAIFAISSNTCGATLAPKGKCTVSVTFTPDQLGTLTGTLAFTDSAPYSPQAVALYGAGVMPATLTPASASFPEEKLNKTSKPKTFKLENKLTTTLGDIVISTTGEFVVSATTCGSSLGVKGSCTISVTFTPTASGTANGVLGVSYNSPSSPVTSDLTGIGN